jgi:hypothetical protein
MNQALSSFQLNGGAMLKTTQQSQNGGVKK